MATWSNQRKNMVYDSGKEFVMTIRCRLTEKALGTRPNDDTVYQTFVASNAPDAPSMEEEIAMSSVDDVVRKGITVFPFGIFFKTSDNVFYDFEDVSDIYNRAPEQLLRNPNGHIITRHKGISVKFDDNGNMIPYYTDSGEVLEGEFGEYPFMWDYQWRGSFKESIGMIQRTGKTKKVDVSSAQEETIPDENSEAPKKRKRRTKAEIEADKAAEKVVKFACSDIKAYKKVVDGNWFVLQRRIPILVPDYWYDDFGNSHPSYVYDEKGHRRLHLFERSIRAETAQGPRTALSSSEFVPAGSEFYFTVKLLDPSYKKALFETMDYKERFGMLQWRSGGMGTLIWTPADENGKPIDVDIDAL